MNHASLFSGIGGFDLAAHWAGIENVFACEIDEFCRKVLAKRFPNTTLYKDIKETKFEQYCGTVDIISGGFPCQPFSTAGKRAGTEDNRYLWGEMLRVVREVQPRWVIAENVRGLTNIANGDTFETVCNDLEVSGYEVQSFIIPALSVGAPHKRERVWIIANSNGVRRNKIEYECGNISKQIPKTPERKLSGTVSLSDRNLTDTNCGKRFDIDRKIQSPTETASEKEQRQNGQRMWGEPGTGFGEFTNTAPNTEGIGHGRRGDRNNSNNRERFIRKNKQDNRKEVWCEINSIDEFDFTKSTSEGHKGSDWNEPNNSSLHRRRQNWAEKWIEAITRIYGMDDGLPGGMDRLNERYKDRSRRQRIKTMGNSIVPQIAYQIFIAIKEANR